MAEWSCTSTPPYTCIAHAGTSFLGDGMSNVEMARPYSMCQKKKSNIVWIASEGKCKIQPALPYARCSEDVCGSGGTASLIRNHDTSLK